jgi:uncharacterized membrane protein
MVHDLIDWVGRLLEVAGVSIIAIGAAYATISFLVRWRHNPASAQFRRYRQTVGRSILLGLEFLVAADIVKTVTTDPTFRSVGVLALIIALRTFLSVELELEIDGRWPWDRRSEPGDDG